MMHFNSAGMAYDGKCFRILDQSLLPQKERWIDCDEVETLVEMIQRLAIRGAPAIGISSAILLGLLAEQGSSPEQLLRDSEKLKAARPTAVNVRNNIEEIQKSIASPDYPYSVVATAEKIFREDVDHCTAIAKHGVSLLRSGYRLLTHCHTGGMATAGRGTALGIILAAEQQLGDIFVWVDETRPLLQGGRLTAWECLRNNIAHKIICDNMAGPLMAQGRVDAIIVGADRIAANGDFANKTGTYSLAVLADYHKIPFYVAAPSTTVDPHCPSGSNIPIEERNPAEIKGVSGQFGNCRWSPDESGVHNPAFDVTPAHLVTAWILERGIFSNAQVSRQNWWQSDPG